MIEYISQQNVCHTILSGVNFMTTGGYLNLRQLDFFIPLLGNQIVHNTGMALGGKSRVNHKLCHIIIFDDLI